MTKHLIAFALISAAVASGTTVAVMHLVNAGKEEVKLAAVDVNKLLGEEVAHRMQSSLSEKQLEVRAQQYTIALEKALDAESAEHGEAIFISPVVVRGVIDKTDAIKARIIAEMEAAGKK